MKSKLAVLSASLVGLGVVPFIASAQSAPECASLGGTFQGIICTIGDILGTILPVIIALGVIWFIWGVVQFVIGGDEEAKSKGREKMIWGIIGLVVIVALWGIVRLVTNTFGLSGTAGAVAPYTPDLTTN